MDKDREISDLKGQLKKLEMRINVLTADNEKLEDRVKALKRNLDRSIISSVNCDDLLKENIELIEVYQRDIIDRIKNIEIKFFPHLVGDLIQLDNIIGSGDDKIINPLDRREVGITKKIRERRKSKKDQE